MVLGDSYKMHEDACEDDNFIEVSVAVVSIQ